MSKVKQTKRIKNRKLVNYDMLLGVLGVTANGSKLLRFTDAKDVYLKVGSNRADSMSAVYCHSDNFKTVFLEKGDVLVISTVAKDEVIEFDCGADGLSKLPVKRVVRNINGELHDIRNVPDDIVFGDVVNMAVIHRLLQTKALKVYGESDSMSLPLTHNVNYMPEGYGVEVEYTGEPVALTINVGSDVTGPINVTKDGSVIYDLKHGLYIPLRLNKGTLALVEELHILQTGKPLPVMSETKQTTNNNTSTAIRQAFLDAEKKRAKLSVEEKVDEATEAQPVSEIVEATKDETSQDTPQPITVPDNA